jgi:FlaA1/EpsC-like NDP-sugar epimerase/lipopolysaccharide/colanic/teichoic acid biosynthesis glycosyltransferase
MRATNPTKLTGHADLPTRKVQAAKEHPVKPIPQIPFVIGKHSGGLGGRIGGFMKRGFDIVVAAVALILLSPLILAISVAIRLRDGGPAFYRAVRVGRYGRPFRLYKFRTMVVGADRVGPGITADGDTRITPIGRWLRNTKLDELPQLLNVLLGQMSLVGPRPEDPRYVALYSRKERTALCERPGMTSAASTSYRYEQQILSRPDWEEVYVLEVMPAKLEIDLAYLSHRTFSSDLGILIRTIAVLFERTDLSRRPLKSLLLGMRNRHFFVIDLLVMLILPSVALVLRTDDVDMLAHYGPSLLVVTLVLPPVALLVFLKGGLYSKYWRYAGVDELIPIVCFGVLAVAIQTAIYLWGLRPLGLVADDFPRSLTLTNGLLMIVAVGAIRYSVRLADRPYHTRTFKPSEKHVLIAGAGAAGVMILDELRRNPALGMRPVAFLDDDPKKQGAIIRGVPVLGRCADIGAVAKDVHACQVIIAMPKVPGKTIRRIVNLCEQAGIQAKTVPGMYELLGGTVSIKQVRDVKIEDLLRREPVATDLAGVAELVRGKRVMVTGGGGSIGSEICRQVMRFDPSALIILGHGENSVFEIHGELTRTFKAKVADSPEDGNTGVGNIGDLGAEGTRIESVIADIRDTEQICSIFQEYRPEVVFHAAAHKHVHLMEMNPREAITNNVLGTRNLLNCALDTGVGRFVMISTDKAVNPVGIMGASKRAAELLVHQAAILGDKPYVAVRFGNVLGSRGSAVLTFQLQIAAGGPVTITHPDMTRYFMTIPEAVQLVLQAAALGKGGEVFMLDMGDPVKILDLAKDLIELSGLEVGRDIDIVYTGMRPGEKLVEELSLDEETYERTGHGKIRTLSNPSNFVPSHLDSMVASLERAARRNDPDELRAGLQALVPEFHPGVGIASTPGKQEQRPDIVRPAQPAQPARHPVPAERVGGINQLPGASLSE